MTTNKTENSLAKPMARMALVALLVTTWASTGWAQTKYVPKDEVESAKAEDVSGWNPSLGVSGTVNFVSNSNVVGQVEGLSMLFGLGLAGGSDYVNGKSVWRNRLSVTESFAKTPVIDRLVKTNDVLDIDSNYSYFLAKKMGVFARLNVKTSVFNAYQYTSQDTLYTILSADPGGLPGVELTDELQVSSAFKPFALSESIGVFAQPYNDHGLEVRVRAGLGGRHTFASGVLINKDDAMTPEVEMQELANVHQAGAEVFVGVDGKAKGGRVTYQAGIITLLPFVNNDAFDRTATELLSVGVGAEVKVAVFDWMSVVYKSSFIKDPQLFPAGEEVNQFQNNLLLTFQFTLVEKDKAKPKASELDLMKKAKEDAEKAADEARKEADEARKEADEARKRAEELERELSEVKEAGEAGEDGAATDDGQPDGAGDDQPDGADDEQPEGSIEPQ